MTGFIIITDNTDKVREKYPQAVGILPWAFWCPETDLSWKTLNWAVGGHIELVPYRRQQMSLYCNEEGKLDDLPPSVAYPADYWPDYLVGDLCITAPCGPDGEEVGLSLADAEELLRKISVWSLRSDTDPSVRVNARV